MHNIAFTPDAWDEFIEWLPEKGVFKKILKLLKDIQRTPTAGIGKPEPLKYEFSGFWSRRITDEHRMVYKVYDDYILFRSFKNHYE